MLHILRRVALCSGLLLSHASSASVAQVPQDVPREHWAYAAVNVLASKGLVKGYPPSGDFFGKRTATRYEMAVVVQRILAQLDDVLSKKADKSEIKTADGGVKPEQLDDIRRLVQEYKTELTVVGTDHQKVKDQIGELNRKVDAVQKATVDAKAAAGAAKDAADEAGTKATAAQKDVDDLKEAFTLTRGEFDALTKDFKSHKLSGYIQSRFEMLDGGGSLFTKSGVGGTGQSPFTGGPVVGGPQYGFLVRRARLKVAGPISTRSEYTLQVDVPSTGAVAVKDANIHVMDLPIPNTSARFGLFPTPFGYELVHSSSTRETPERAFGFSDSTAPAAIFKTTVSGTGGTVTAGSVVPLFLGQDRDTGAMFTWNMPSTLTPSSKIMLGVFNGEGRGAGGVRNLNNQVDMVGRFETTMLDGTLDLGISGYYGSLAVRSGPPSGTPAAPVAFMNAYRMFGGADVRYFSPWGTILRAEWMGGTYEVTPDRAQHLQGNHAQAWYVMAKHPLSKRLDVAVKYDEFMPISQAGKVAAGLGRMQLVRKTLQGGLLYYLDDATRFRLWYMKGLTPFDPSAAAGHMRSRLGLVTAEVQVSY